MPWNSQWRRGKHGLDTIPSSLGCTGSNLSSHSSSLRYRNTPAWAGTGFQRGSILLNPQIPALPSPNHQPLAKGLVGHRTRANRSVTIATPPGPISPTSGLDQTPSPPLGTATHQHPHRSRGWTPKFSAQRPWAGPAPLSVPFPWPTAPLSPPPLSHSALPQELQPSMSPRSFPMPTKARSPSHSPPRSPSAPRPSSPSSPARPGAHPRPPGPSPAAPSRPFPAHHERRRSPSDRASWSAGRKFPPLPRFRPRPGAPPNPSDGPWVSPALPRCAAASGAGLSWAWPGPARPSSARVFRYQRDAGLAVLPARAGERNRLTER